MTRTVAFLRAVNVGGRNKVPMKDLISAMTEAGFVNVRSYLNSGNLVFDAKGSAKTTQIKIEKILRDQFSVTTPVAVRSLDDLIEMAEEFESRHDFVSLFTTDAGNLPKTPLRSSGGDYEVVRLTHRYALIVRHGTKGDLKFLEKATGVPGTVRYPRVVSELINRAKADRS
jgi:hypothetical protein